MRTVLKRYSCGMGREFCYMLLLWNWIPCNQLRRPFPVQCTQPFKNVSCPLREWYLSTPLFLKLRIVANFRWIWNILFFSMLDLMPTLNAFGKICTLNRVYSTYVFNNDHQWGLLLGKCGKIVKKNFLLGDVTFGHNVTSRLMILISVGSYGLSF